MSSDEERLLRERAYAFLRNAEQLYEQGQYDLAAFNVEQACQLLVKQRLLAKVGAYPRTRPLMSILRDLSRIAPEVKRMIEDPRNVVMITKLEDAYISSRCIPRRYEKLEVEEMLRFAKEVFFSVLERV